MDDSFQTGLAEPLQRSSSPAQDIHAHGDVLEPRARPGSGDARIHTLARALLQLLTTKIRTQDNLHDFPGEVFLPRRLYIAPENLRKIAEMPQALSSPAGADERGRLHRQKAQQRRRTPPSASMVRSKKGRRGDVDGVCGARDDDVGSDGSGDEEADDSSAGRRKDEKQPKKQKRPRPRQQQQQQQQQRQPTRSSSASATMFSRTENWLESTAESTEPNSGDLGAVVDHAETERAHESARHESESAGASAAADAGAETEAGAAETSETTAIGNSGAGASTRNSYGRGHRASHGSASAPAPDWGSPVSSLSEQSQSASPSPSGRERQQRQERGSDATDASASASAIHEIGRPDGHGTDRGGSSAEFGRETGRSADANRRSRSRRASRAPSVASIDEASDGDSGGHIAEGASFAPSQKSPHGSRSASSASSLAGGGKSGKGGKCVKVDAGLANHGSGGEDDDGDDDRVGAKHAKRITTATSKAATRADGFEDATVSAEARDGALASKLWDASLQVVGL